MSHVAERGLTLIEILIAVAILASATVLILQALVRGAYALVLAENRTNAYIFSRVKMADVDLMLRQGLEPKPHGQFHKGHTPYEWDVQIEPLELEPKLQQVTLTVGWRQGRHDYSTQLISVARIPEEGNK